MVNSKKSLSVTLLHLVRDPTEELTHACTKDRVTSFTSEHKECLNYSSIRSINSTVYYYFKSKMMQNI